MDNIFDEMGKNLDKLRKNLTQMTEAQKIQYAKPLAALKNKIKSEAAKIAFCFLTSGIKVLKDDDPKDIADGINEIIAQETEKGTFKKAGKILFSTYDVDKFLEALRPAHDRIWYECYAPYWVRHCKKTENEEYPYWNDIIRMRWWAECRIWSDEEGKSFTLMLPPTMDLVEEERKGGK